MRIFTRFAARAALACLTIAPALAAPPAIPPSAPVNGTTLPVTPTGATLQTTLGAALATPRVPRGNVMLWKPRQSMANQDTAGSIFPTTKTAYLTMEVPDDFTAVQLVFGTNTATGYGIADAAVSGSSQWGSTLYGTPGITPYDGSGNALTALSRVTFANAGLNASPFPAALGTSCTTVASGSAGSTLNVASSAGASVNQPVLSTWANGLYLFPQTYVASVTTGAVTLSQAPAALPPVGSTVCFLPIAATVPAATQPPITALYRSDWVPVSSYARIDSPVHAGGLVQGPAGLAAGTTAGTPTATSVPLSAPTTALIPRGTKVEFCQALTTTNTTTPVNTLPFAAVPSPVVAGMNFSLASYPEHQFNEIKQSFPSPVTITGVTSTSITLSDAIDQSSYSARYVAYQPLTVATAAAAGGSTVTVASLPANVATGMWVLGTGIGGASGPMNSPANLITGIAGNTLTLTSVHNGPLNVGDTIYAGVTLTSNGSVVEPTTTFATTQGVLPGQLITGTGIQSNTYASAPTVTQMVLTHAPTATIASGATVQACDPLVTSADTPAGASALPFNATTYPKRLLLVRVNYSTVGAVYQQNGTDQGNSMALMPGLIGTGRIEAGTCGAGNDGVLSPASIGNLTGSCSRNNQIFLWGVKFLTARMGVEIMNFGDSHFGGDTTVASSAPAETRVAEAMTTPQLPVWAANCGYSGKNSYTFINDCLPMLQEVKPAVVTIAGYTFNDIGTSAAAQLYRNNADGLASMVRGYGGLPVISTEYERQVYGCNSVASVGFTAIEGFREAFEAAQVQYAAANMLPLLDNAAILQDPLHPNFLNPAYSVDCIHANDAGHAARATALQALIQPFLGN